MLYEVITQTILAHAGKTPDVIAFSPGVDRLVFIVKGETPEAVEESYNFV